MTAPIRIEGGLFAPDFLDQLARLDRPDRADLPGLRAEDFGLAPGTLDDEIAAAYRDARTYWSQVRDALDRITDARRAVRIVRDRWLRPFFSLLGYDLVDAPPTPAGSVVFPISHRADPTPDAPPVHLVAPTQSLGSPDPTTTPRWSPHVLLQEFLNRTDALWGIVSNGSVLRVLRRSTALVRPSYLEADLEAIIGGDRFDEFARLYRIIHRSRLPRTAADADACLLERWYRIGIEQGGRVRDRLRDGVEQAILTLANDLLAYGYRPTDALSFYRDLLRFIYRLLFLFVADARGLMGGSDLYRNYYSVSRLIARSINHDAADDGFDLWHSLRALWYALRTEDIAPALGLPPLNGALFAELPFDGQRLPNTTVLAVINALTWYRPTPADRPRRVNYASLDTEELGSVYESLLDYHPQLDDNGQCLSFTFTTGSERKTTGSYYTPPELVQELVERTLVPLINDRLRTASTPAAQRAAILDLRILDPACGSGHFLLAAARTLGRAVARLDAKGHEPSPDEVRRAIREVIAHCIYGVDANPLAVELARVALWIEAHDGDKPLTFLDHRIRCGDSLVGVRDLTVLTTGIPAGAFDPVSTDVRSVARDVAKRNTTEQAGQLGLFDAPPAPDLSALAAIIRHLDAIADTTPADIRRKQELLAQMHQRATALQTACDLWTAAFFQPRTPDTPLTAWITTAAVRMALAGTAPPAAVAAAQAWTVPTPWLHWPLAFPDVIGERGGFDVVLGNPPWERIKLQEQEFFAARDRTIANAPNAAARKRLITALPQTNPTLWNEYQAALHRAESISRFLRQSGQYPLAGRGDINTYAVFVERIRAIMRPNGRAGVIVPTGIATDDTTKHLFAALVEQNQLAGLFDFENR
ncbi:MAG: hypothetical protein KatS3mg055_0761 [Chloroflexus sp.]|nr:N-6 DNA methylase [Chloroflexus sp.]GIV88243.1 MAG: hypothetical protein KatS3mg055_0761 [Chloroflexus sp.]